MSEILNDNDNKLLEMTMSLRERMIMNISRLTDADLPKKPSELMAVTNLLESVDRTVLAKAKIRADESSTKNQEEERALFRNLMIELHTNKPVAVTSAIETSVREVPAYQSTGLSISEGELIPLSDNCMPKGT